MTKQEYDERLKRMRMTLKMQSQEQKDYHEFMHSIQPSNSRQNIIPGQNEAQQEALRSQLLIGKLKANEHLPNAERMRRKAGPSGQAARESFPLPLDQEAWDRGDVSEASSRAIPAICSDQVSAMSFTSSEMQHRDEATAAADAARRAGDSEPQHEITKLPSRRALGK